MSPQLLAVNLLCQNHEATSVDFALKRRSLSSGLSPSYNTIFAYLKHKSRIQSARLHLQGLWCLKHLVRHFNAGARFLERKFQHRAAIQEAGRTKIQGLKITKEKALPL